MHQWKLERRPSARVTSHAAICGGVALALFRNSHAHLPSATMNDTYEVVTIAVDMKHFSRYNYRANPSNVGLRPPDPTELCLKIVIFGTSFFPSIPLSPMQFFLLE
ncbi:hypothetical protein B296_00041051 [Ensete ventricosum]|uniref:Uncharacterized protein n=1 Tax=Ensete ventricosum TaxID=4639 RepID=A0A426Z0X0_ENSVE|nr:hypothetical protein B296_00041051 [Ensete ventricosum]